MLYYIILVKQNKFKKDKKKLYFAGYVFPR